MLNARPRSWHASLATVGCEAREKAQGPMLHPSVTGKGKAGRANEREPPQASLPRTSGDGSSTEEQDPPLGGGSGGRSFDVGHESTTVPGYRRRPTPAASHQCGTWKPRHRSGGEDQPPVGRPQGERTSVAGQDGQEANGGSRKATGKPGQDDRTLHIRSFSDSWPHTRPGAWARKGADVSRVTL